MRRVGAHAFELSVATMTSNSFRPVLDIATDGGFGQGAQLHLTPLEYTGPADDGMRFSVKADVVQAAPIAAQSANKSW